MLTFQHIHHSVCQSYYKMFTFMLCFCNPMLPGFSIFFLTLPTFPSLSSGFLAGTDNNSMCLFLNIKSLHHTKGAECLRSTNRVDPTIYIPFYTGYPLIVFSDCLYSILTWATDHSHLQSLARILCLLRFAE